MKANEVAEKITALLDETGIGTYVIVLQDPDSRNELCAMEGHKPWLYGELLLKADEIKTAYNADVTRQALGLVEP